MLDEKKRTRYILYGLGVLLCISVIFNYGLYQEKQRYRNHLISQERFQLLDHYFYRIDSAVSYGYQALAGNETTSGDALNEMVRAIRSGSRGWYSSLGLERPSNFFDATFIVDSLERSLLHLSSDIAETGWTESKREQLSRLLTDYEEMGKRFYDYVLALETGGKDQAPAILQELIQTYQHYLAEPPVGQETGTPPPGEEDLLTEEEIRSFEPSAWEIANEFMNEVFPEYEAGEMRGWGATAQLGQYLNSVSLGYQRNGVEKLIDVVTDGQILNLSTTYPGEVPSSLRPVETIRFAAGPLIEQATEILQKYWRIESISLLNAYEKTGRLYLTFHENIGQITVADCFYYVVIPLDSGEIEQIFATILLQETREAYEHTLSQLVPKLTEEEARNLINPANQVAGAGTLHYDPDHRLTWQFPVVTGDRSLWIYLDADTGEELKIETRQTLE